jgi:thioesterase domain-containing protein
VAAAAKCPATTHFIEEIPRLPSLKPDVAALTALDLTWCSTKDTAEPDKVAPTPLRIAPRVQDAVKRAWTAVCGARSVPRDLPWEMAGGDSLKALKLLLHIEEALGRRLSTEVLSAGMTPSGLSAAIERGIGALPEAATQQGAEDGRVTIFLMPGILGDEPLLAQFRYALRDRIRFVCIGYPDWRETIAAKANFDAIVTAALGQILRQCSDRPIHLAGYSFGGFVASATAHRLVELGRQVAFLGLLDTRRWSQFEAPPLTTAAKSMKLIGKIREKLKRGDVGVNLCLIFRSLLELRAFVLLEAFAWLCMRAAGQRAAANAHPQLLLLLRSYALRGWGPSAVPVPTFFFRSEDEDPPHQPDWSALCSPFSVVPVDGDHHSMMAPPNAERLYAGFLDALRAADANLNW